MSLCCSTRSLQWIEKRRVRVAGVKDNDTKRIAIAAVIAGHLHVRRLYHCLTLSDGDGRPVFHLQSEGTLQHIDSHRKPVRMKNGFIAGFELAVKTRSSCFSLLGMPSTI